MKKVYKGTCPCGEEEFALQYFVEKGEVKEIYCPFCQVEIDQEEPESDEDNDD